MQIFSFFPLYLADETQTTYMMKLKDINEEERPRERLFTKGAEALSNAELLAILLRTGYGKKNVLEISHELLHNACDLTGLSSMSIDKMMEVPGIGKDKAVTITAAFELGRRLASESSTSPRTPITTSKQVYELMAPILKGLDHEECWILYLNRSNIVIFKEKLTSGGLSSTSIDTNMIMRKALEKRADGLIMTHNHPSGNPHPGQADIKETERLKKASNTFGISLLDHLIIANGCFYSFADEQITMI